MMSVMSRDILTDRKTLLELLHDGTCIISRCL